jgi:hypothetical protein
MITDDFLCTESSVIMRWCGCQLGREWRAAAS